MDFNYISSNIPGPGAKLEDMEQDLVGCSCVEECANENGCQCLRYGQDNYAENGTLLLAAGHLYPVLECHENCSCASRARPCRNRVVQHGMKVKLEPTYAEGVGYGLKAQQAIPSGQFVIEYIGEIISREEAAKRASERSKDDHNYIFTVEEFIQGSPSATFIDASRHGNLARFINHSCEPNLRREVIRVGQRTPCLGLFACRDINPGEELSYDYGEVSPEAIASRTGKPCRCGAKQCRGFLPSGSFLT